MSASGSDTATGWLIYDKGQHFLTTETGWIQLTGLDRARLRGLGITPESAVRVTGTKPDPVTMDVEEIQGAATRSPESSGRRPYFAVHPIPALHTGSALRGAVHSWMRERGYPEMFLPTIWRQSEEYGIEEFQLSHSARPESGDRLILLQSPEFALITALAQGISRIFTFGRCYRYEDNPRMGLEGDYLIEFEQLVVAAAFTSLDEMMRLAEELLSHLAAAIGQVLRPADFYRLVAKGPMDGGGQLPNIEDLLLFTVPETWNRKALKLLLDRLGAVGATAHPMEAEAGLNRPGTGLPEGAVPGSRWAVIPGPNRTAVQRILDISTSVSPTGFGSASHSPGNAESNTMWNPTWNLHPTLQWNENEGVGTKHETRSITSRRLQGADGTERIADAELYIAGREVVHVREYASVEQFRENLKLAGVEDMAHCYDYLYGPLEIAPPGMVGIFIGWERLLSVLTGSESAAAGQLFPRAGDGERRNPAMPA